MTIDQNYLTAGRDIRSIWRTEEEDYISETVQFAKRNMSLLDYLASVSHAGHEIAVRTSSYRSQGPLIHIGNDFFSIVSCEQPRLIQSFVLNSNEEAKVVADFEIDVIAKSQKSDGLRLLRRNKSFRSLLDDIILQPEHAEIETRHGNLYKGEFDIFSDCIAFKPNESSEKEVSLVSQGTVIIPMNTIVSILYSL